MSAIGCEERGRRVPIISVILPVFNGGRFIAEAIESIKIQSIIDFECLIIDDGSTDQTAAIVQNCIGEDRRFELRSRENKGLIASLNEGLNWARGEFVARMDADDICLPSRFSRQLSLMRVEQLDVCGCHYVRIDGRGRVLGAKLVPISHRYCLLMLARTVPFAHGSVLLRRQFLEDFNLNYDQNLYSKAEDYLLWVRMSAAGAKFGNVDDFLFKYREVGGSLSSNKDNRYHAKKIARLYRKESTREMDAYIEECIQLPQNQLESECLANNLLNRLISRPLYALTHIASVNKKALMIAILKKIYFLR